MDDPTQAILERAADRGRKAGLGYHGAVTPIEAWTLLQRGDAKLIDVRTEAEWQYVGHIPGSALVEWRRFKATAPNPDFVPELRSQVDPQTPVMFLCRSAQRSHAAAAAAAAAGYETALNILEGFEGDIDGDGHRGSLGGWRKAGLPWVQS
jgi:rhodanese-related sulfurtransferase